MVKEEVLSDHEYEEPVKKKKKTKIAENSEASSDLHKIIDENRHNIDKIEEKIESLERENVEKELEMSELAAKNSRLEHKISKFENHFEKLETKLSEFIAKSIHECRKSAGQKIQKLEAKVFNMEKEFGEKMEGIEQRLRLKNEIINQLQLKVSHMESAGNEGKQKVKTEPQEEISIDSHRSEIQRNAESNDISQLKQNLSILEEDLKALKTFEEEQKQWSFDIYERLGKFQETTVPTLQSYEDGLRRLYEDQENTQKSVLEVKKGFFNLQIDFEEKTKDLYRLIQECREMNVKSAHPHQNIVSTDDCKFPPTNAEIEYQYKCIFCKMLNHRSIDCRNIPQYSDRLQVLREQGRCTKCLELPSNHFSCQRARVMCSNCHWDPKTAVEKYHSHHPIVCPFNDRSQFVDSRKRMENERRLNHGLPPRFK